MIVVEGPDGSGKTNLVEKLRADLKLELIPRAVDSNAEYQVPLDVWVDDVQRRVTEPIIVDRHQLISHLVYGPTMRRELIGRFVNHRWLADTLEHFWASRPIVILCLPPLLEVKSNVEADEYKVALEDIEVFYWTYHAWLADNLYKPGVVHWDYTYMSYEVISKFCRALLKQKGIL